MINIINKQTVYLPVQEANLEENYYLQDSNGEFYLEQKGYFFTPEQLNEYIQNVIKQSLETAAENVGFIETTSEKLNSEEYKPFVTADDGTIWIVNKQSITNTLDETYNKLKV